MAEVSVPDDDPAGWRLRIAGLTTNPTGREAVHRHFTGKFCDATSNRNVADGFHRSDDVGVITAAAVPLPAAAWISMTRPGVLGGIRALRGRLA
jgi:hypothetical protein